MAMTRRASSSPAPVVAHFGSFTPPASGAAAGPAIAVGRSPLRSQLQHHHHHHQPSSSPHLLRLQHLQQVASWTSASIPPLGAFLGSRLASTCASLGCPPPPSENFSCERCESILQVGLNCSVRVRKRVRTKLRGSAGTVAKSINCVVYSCHFCSFENVKSGTPKAYVKTKVTQVAALDKLAKLGQDLSLNTPQEVQECKISLSKPLPSLKGLSSESPGSSGKKAKRKGWLSLRELSASKSDISPSGSSTQRPLSVSKSFGRPQNFQPKQSDPPLKATAMVAESYFETVAAGPSIKGGSLNNNCSIKVNLEQKSAMDMALGSGLTGNRQVEIIAFKKVIVEPKLASELCSESFKEIPMGGVDDHACTVNKGLLQDPDLEVGNTVGCKATLVETSILEGVLNTKERGYEAAIHLEPSYGNDGSRVPIEESLKNNCSIQMDLEQKSAMDIALGFGLIGNGQVEVSASEKVVVEGKMAPELCPENFKEVPMGGADDHSCTANKEPLQDPDLEVGNTTGCKATLVEAPILEEVPITKERGYEVAIHLEPSYGNDGSKAPVGMISELTNVKEILDGDSKLLSMGASCQPECASISSGDGCINNDHGSDFRSDFVDGSPKFLESTLDSSTYTSFGHDVENGINGNDKSRLSEASMQCPLPSEYKMDAGLQNVKNGRVSEAGVQCSLSLECTRGTDFPDHGNVRVSEAGVQCSLPLESETMKDTVMQIQDNVMDIPVADQDNNKVSEAGVQCSLPLECKTVKDAARQSQDKVTDSSAAERGQSDCLLHELRSVARELKRARKLKSLSVQARHRSLKRQLLVIPNLRTQIQCLLDQMVKVKDTVDQLTAKLTVVGCQGPNIKPNTDPLPDLKTTPEVTTLLDLSGRSMTQKPSQPCSGKKVKAKRLQIESDVQGNTMSKDGNKKWYVSDSDCLQMSTAEEAILPSKKKMRSEDSQAAAMCNLDGTDWKQPNKCGEDETVRSRLKTTSVLDEACVERQEEARSSMNFKFPPLEFLESSDGRADNVIVNRKERISLGSRKKGKTVSRKIPVLQRFGRRWFAVGKANRKLVWRVVI